MNPQKGQIHEALLAEQGYVCIYCGKRITTAFQSSHIEHFRPQSEHSALRFDWTNLFASCGPTGKAKTPKTCGNAKNNWDPEGKAHVDPTDPQCSQRFSYDGNGSITSSKLGDDSAKTMINELRLDDSTLNLDRSVIIRALEKQILAGEINSSNKAHHIAAWRSTDAQGRFIGYGHVAVRYLEDEIP